jgi:hypothetical protein
LEVWGWLDCTPFEVEVVGLGSLLAASRERGIGVSLSNVLRHIHGRPFSWEYLDGPERVVHRPAEGHERRRAQRGILPRGEGLGHGGQRPEALHGLPEALDLHLGGGHVELTEAAARESSSDTFEEPNR